MPENVHTFRGKEYLLKYVILENQCSSLIFGV